MSGFPIKLALELNKQLTKDIDKVVKMQSDFDKMAVEYGDLTGATKAFTQQLKPVQKEYFLDYLKPSDYKDMLSMLIDPESVKQSGTPFDAKTIKRIVESDDAMHFAIRDRLTLQCIGSIETFVVNNDSHYAELFKWLKIKGFQPNIRTLAIGYGLARQYHGRGLATTIVKSVCKIAFNIFDANMLVARALESNKASIRVLEKNGFQMAFKKDIRLDDDDDVTAGSSAAGAASDAVVSCTYWYLLRPTVF